MTEKIKRYKYGYTDDGFGGQRYLSLIESKDGSVVRFDDHEAALAARDARIANLEGLLAQPVASEPVAICNRYDVDWMPGSEHLKEGDKLYAHPPAPAIPEGIPPHAEIYVGNGKFAICDWDDWESIKPFNWCLTTRNNGGCLYAQSWDCHNTKTRKRISMHGLIMVAPPGMVIDHINGDGLDNRKSNLRLATIQQNAFNQRGHGGSSQYKGVCFDKESNLWRAYIRVDGKRRHLGRHGSELDAAKAYNMAAKESFGDYAKFNILEGSTDE